MVVIGNVRAFIAVPVPPDILEQLKDLQDSIRACGVSASYPKIASIHLTLKFLGEVPTEEISRIKEFLALSITPFERFEIRVRGVGVFPSPRRPRVVWAGIPADSFLEDFQKRVESGMREAGFPAEDRKFRPHLTLARIKSGRNLKRLSSFVERSRDFDAGSFSADPVRLYRSILRPEGAEYRVLAEYNAESGR